MNTKMNWFVEAYKNNALTYMLHNTNKCKGTAVLPTGAGKSGEKYGDMMNNHITNEDKGRDYWYTKYAEIIGCGGCIMSDEHNGFNFESDAMYSDLSNGNYLWSFVASSYAVKFNDITNEMAKRVIRGNTKGEASDKDAECLYGTKSELENWKHFVFNNKLPLFINIVMTIDQHNNSKEFIPWLINSTLMMKSMRCSSSQKKKSS